MTARGRPFEKLPAGARKHLESMAASGLLSESAAATALGMPLDQFRRVVQEHAPSKLIWETALSIERDQLLDALYCRAVDGDTRAAQTLLAVRHGLSEKAPQGSGGGVSVVFNLPSAMDPQAYLEAIQVKQEALPNASSD
ncbi:hypothetical protein [Kineobactrum salinum]|uniref:Uncharacterized protein n=1 Tax=Kineobactrum salinum TaxID=2708301 RepID=A0A6C0UAQ8_9GAMM|nr:hypothetical protein [Kineobactrum salinum]QIB66974.1 hypothetical protein G3T16_17845 [Kineobactrum salinum]